MNSAPDPYPSPGAFPPPAAQPGGEPVMPRRVPSPGPTMIVAGLVGAVVFGCVTFMITWLLTYPGNALSDDSGLTAEGEDIMRSWSTIAALNFAAIAALLGGSLGVLFGLLGHRHRYQRR